ncbi:MAG: hypothetical protein WBY53_13585 [Acidobacteriaceae bacterium]
MGVDTLFWGGFWRIYFLVSGGWWLWETSGVERLREFDMAALFGALEAERVGRGLSWVEMVAEVNVVFRGTPSIPVAVGTVRGMLGKRSVTSAVVLQVLGWMRRTPESFLEGAEVGDGERLPESGPGRVLRFDTRAMYEALNVRRLERGLTWRKVAAELPGFSQGMLTNLAEGPLIGFPRVMMIPQWLGVSAARFVRACGA